MYATDSWRVRVPASKLMKYLPLGVLLLAGLGMSVWVYISAMGGNSPTDMMGEPGSLSEYGIPLQFGAMVVLGGFFWLFWRHRKATLRMEGDRLVLKKTFGSRSLPISRLNPSCAKAYADERSGIRIGVICYLTGSPSDRGFRVLGYGGGCPEEMLTMPDSHGQTYDVMIMKREDFSSFLNAVSIYRH